MTIAPGITTAPTGPMLGVLSDLSFTQLVNEALRHYQSTLALSRSPLANSALVTPTLVKDEASPTAEERGHGLRLVLQWAVNQLAPGAPEYPLGEYRPLDDPTWRDPHWWRYNILRHRYLEPLHPDDFVGGGRYTESLLALTGISSPDAFFDERSRAIRALAERLRQQLIDGQANGDLQRLALQEVTAPLEKQQEAAKLLSIAATFDDVFPRSLVMEMAAQERLSHSALRLDELIGQRFLLTGDEGVNLWLAPLLRAYVYERQPKTDRQRRHRLIAAYYESQDEPLPAARHWQRAGQDSRAVQVLLPVAEELIHELQLKELIDFFQQVDPKQLSGEQRYRVPLLLSDLFQRSGQHEEALAACRQALQASAECSTKQARVYRRMGKLYESRNQLHALRYYQQAVERFAPTDPELAELLKDRGWLYYLRQEWQKAEADLQQALHFAPPAMKTLRADIDDAIANLYRKMNNLEQALIYAERALASREEVGDLLRIAKSQINLGLLYRTMQEYPSALAAYQEAMATYQKIHNQEMMAVALLNIGAAYFLDKKMGEAIDAYHQSLHICQEIDLPLIAMKAYYNLAEAYGASEERSSAAGYWQAGYQLCQQHHFDDQEALFLALRNTLQLPEPTTPEAQAQQTATPAVTLPRLDADEQLILSLVKTEGSITPKRLMDAAKISRATATRRLSALVEKGMLVVEGKGRATCYIRAASTPSALPAGIPSTITDVEIVSLRSALQPHQAELTARYGVTALGVITQDITASVTLAPVLKLIACFVTLPDLRAYRQLKGQLSRILQRESDLLLEEEAVPFTAASLVWLW